MATMSPPPPPSLANASWGWFSVLFAHDHPLSHTIARWAIRSTRDTRHVTTTTPDHLWATTTTTNPSLTPRARWRDLVSVSTAPPPSLTPTARRRGFVCFYGTNPLPRPNSETEGVRLLCYSTTAPSLALSEQRGSICLVVIRYIIVYIVVIRYIIGYIY